MFHILFIIFCIKEKEKLNELVTCVPLYCNVIYRSRKQVNVLEKTQYVIMNTIFNYIWYFSLLFLGNIYILFDLCQPKWFQGRVVLIHYKNILQRKSWWKIISSSVKAYIYWYFVFKIVSKFYISVYLTLACCL